LAAVAVELDYNVDHGPGVLHRFEAAKAKSGLHTHEGNLFERALG
jgi:hypothetical protein